MIFDSFAVFWTRRNNTAVDSESVSWIQRSVRECGIILKGDTDICLDLQHVCCDEILAKVGVDGIHNGLLRSALCIHWAAGGAGYDKIVHVKKKVVKGDPDIFGRWSAMQ